MRRPLLLVLVLAVALVTRPGAELEEVALVTVMGVQRRGAGDVDLVALGEDGERFWARGADLPEAQEALDAAGDRRLELTHVSALVVERGMALGPLLRQEVLHRKSGYDATVWLAAEPAALLAEGENPAGRLRSLIQNAGVEAPTLLEALADLRETGTVRLPVLSIEEEQLVTLGYETVGEVWKDGG